MSIYITQQKKEEIEVRIAEIEKQMDSHREFASVFHGLSGRILMLKEILSNAVVLPVEESWAAFDLKMDIISYPNGVIIKNPIK